VEVMMSVCLVLVMILQKRSGRCPVEWRELTLFSTRVFQRV
jgi:hypothetical protein